MCFTLRFACLVLSLAARDVCDLGSVMCRANCRTRPGRGRTLPRCFMRACTTCLSCSARSNTIILVTAAATARSSPTILRFMVLAPFCTAQENVTAALIGAPVSLLMSTHHGCCLYHVELNIFASQHSFNAYFRLMRVQHKTQRNGRAP